MGIQCAVKEEEEEEKKTQMIPGEHFDSCVIFLYLGLPPFALLRGPRFLLSSFILYIAWSCLELIVEYHLLGSLSLLCKVLLRLAKYSLCHIPHGIQIGLCVADWMDDNIAVPLNSNLEFGLKSAFNFQ